MSSAILAGSSSHLLAQNISSAKNLPLIHHRVVHFVNSEMKIALPKDFKPFKKITIVQSTSNPANNNLMELCLLADTLKREGVEHVEAIIPYFGYARQDKQHLPGECVSVEVIINLLKAVGVEVVYTVDIHNDEVLSKTSLLVKNLSAMEYLANKVYSDLGLNEDSEAEITIASPDYGGIKRAELFASNFYKNPRNKEIVSMKKRRDLERTHYSETVELRGEIRDKKIILIDDVSTSGGTLLNALELCKANGVREAYALVVHADFASGVAEKLQNSDFQKIYTTNSIEKTVDNLNFIDKVRVVDVSEIF